MTEPSKIERALESRLRLGLMFALQGDFEIGARFIDAGDPPFEGFAQVLATVPPIVDGTAGELDQLVADSVAGGSGVIVIPLRTASGATVASATFQWVVDLGAPSVHRSVSVELQHTERQDSVPHHVQRGPDSLGRLPLEQFTGSPHLRLQRLFRAAAISVEATDQNPQNDTEAAFLIEYADGDIYNGSLHQFYSNSTGNFAGEFPGFAERIGAPIKGAAVRTANTLFAGVELRDRTARNAVLDKLSDEESEKLDTSTDDYYGAEESIVDLLVAFVENNRDSFLY